MAESTTGSFLLETAQESFSLSPDNSTQQNNVSEEQHETKDETISEESIFQRISSHKGMKSYQLGKQLSCRWSTGAGPRIGCLRDYPSGLQSHALEQVNLSPRSKRRIRVEFLSRASTPTGSMLSRSSSQTIGGSCHL
ncbi:UNVERIFIED_CONTAM: IQ domain-containing protein IQM2 [Sesamum latifolium]|uniref:IQ domain-containing protein IQM2 n=1 Tax=Sesamum latifolium TaxID=2727402 RepID=A0AAW2Y448_9LAMI